MNPVAAAPQALSLLRDCEAIQIPFGQRITLSRGSVVFVTQSLGGGLTVQAPTSGGLYRIAAHDADALGLEVPEGTRRPSASGPVDEDAVWRELRTCYDPEIPVDIVELGLVYDLSLSDAAAGRRVTVRMTLTAPGCGMGPAIASDVRAKIEALPGVAEADVQLVWDPPWTPAMMTPAARRQLGLS